MAGGAESNEVFGRIMSQVDPFGLVMDFEVSHAAAVLAMPVVAFEDLEVEAAVGFRIELAARAFGL